MSDLGGVASRTRNTSNWGKGYLTHPSRGIFSAAHRTSGCQMQNVGCLICLYCGQARFAIVSSQQINRIANLVGGSHKFETLRGRSGRPIPNQCRILATGTDSRFPSAPSSSWQIEYNRDWAGLFLRYGSFPQYCIWLFRNYLGRYLGRELRYRGGGWRSPVGRPLGARPRGSINTLLQAGAGLLPSPV